MPPIQKPRPVPVKPDMTPQWKKFQRTPGFEQKPRPTPKLMADKKAKPMGHCAAAIDQKARILRNKAKQERNQLGSDGFPKSGNSIVRGMLMSPEGAILVASLMVGMAAFDGLVKGAIGALFGGFRMAGKGGIAAPRIPAATVAATPRVKQDATRGQRPRKQARPAAGGGSEDGSTAPRSAARQAPKPDAYRPATPGPRDLRSESIHRGNKLRASAKQHFGDEHVYGVLATLIATKGGSTVRENPWDDPGTFTRLEKLHAGLGDYLKDQSPTSIEIAQLREKLERNGSRMAGNSRSGDRDDMGAALLSDVIARAEAWKAANAPDPLTAGPKPEATEENEGGGSAAKPGNEPKPDDEPEFTLPKPKWG